MKASRKYPTVKVRPLGWARKQHNSEEIAPAEHEAVLDKLPPDPEKHPVASEEQLITAAEIAEPDAEMAEAKPVIEAVVLEEPDSHPNQEKISILPFDLPEFPAPLLVPKKRKKRKKAKCRREKVQRPAFPPPAVINKVLFHIRADITVLSEDIKPEPQESKVVKTPPEENAHEHIVEMPPTEVSVDDVVQPTKTSLFRRLFKIEATPKPVTSLTLFLRKVYLLLLVEMVFTALWIGTVTLSSELQGAMRRNYWLVVFWFFILLDVLWVKCRFPAVAERKEGSALLAVLQVCFT